MTEQMVINLIELQFVSISNPLKKKWLRPHIQEFKRQKIQVETGHQSHFQIADYLGVEIKKTKSIFFEQKRWLEICLKLFKELENISSTNYAPIYLIILQVFMGHRFWEGSDFCCFAYHLLHDTNRNPPWSLDEIISKYSSTFGLLHTDYERVRFWQRKWLKACLKYLDSLERNPTVPFSEIQTVYI